MHLEELFDYKNKLMEDLCKNPRIVQMVTGDETPLLPAHDLAYARFFPYEHIPKTASEAGVYICFEVTARKVPNKTFYYPVIYIWIAAHESKMRPEWGGVLTDQIAIEIDRMLNGNREYGQGELELSAVDTFVPTTDYLGRSLAYATRDFNRGNGRHPIPENRKRGV